MIPSDTLDVKINGEGRELYMSFGLLNLLATMVPTPELVPTMSLDPEARTAILTACFTPRKKSGKATEEIDIDDMEFSIEDAESTLGWVTDHLMAFFVRALRKVMATTEANKDELANLASSLNGLKASTSGTA